MTPSNILLRRRLSSLSRRSRDPPPAAPAGPLARGGGFTEMSESLVSGGKGINKEDLPAKQYTSNPTQVR